MPSEVEVKDEVYDSEESNLALMDEETIPMSHNIYEYSLVVLVVVLSPILLPLWLVHTVVVNYLPCSILGRLTEYAQCTTKPSKACGCNKFTLKDN